MRIAGSCTIGGSGDVIGSSWFQEYTTEAAAIRGDFKNTDLVKAEEIVALWENANTALTAAYKDLQDRRAARLAVLDATVPLGPSIPKGTSPADATLIQQAFRSALTEARNALPTSQASSSADIVPLSTATGTLAAMLNDAEKFGDDNLRRAVLTAAFENGDMGLVRSWTDMMGVTAQIDEFNELQLAIAGQGFGNFTVVQALGLLPKPSEAWQLPQLAAAQDAAIRDSYRPGGANSTRSGYFQN